jgi:hypothetical protein
MRSAGRTTFATPRTSSGFRKAHVSVGECNGSSKMFAMDAGRPMPGIAPCDAAQMRERGREAIRGG